MTTRFATESEIKTWNTSILANPDKGNVFQSYELARQKDNDGWKPRFVFTGNVAITILEKSVIGLGKLWYIPKGPGLSSVRQLDDLLPSLKAFARTHGAFMIKIEPEIKKSDEVLADLLKLGLCRVRPIQPNFSTVTLNISGSLDSVLAGLNQKGRHAINRAKRDGVTTELVDASDENCKKMYELLSETAAGSFGIRGFHYYKTFWQRYAKTGIGQLFFAYVDNKIVAGAFALAFGEKGTYKDGASVRERAVYGASHLLQWRVIEWMKTRGVKIHDLCGTPPSDQIKNPDHRHYGIGRFKTSFNKEVTDYVGAYDIPVKPHAYKVWATIGERIALRLYRKLGRESYY